MSNLVASFPSAQEFQTMKEMGSIAIKSGLLPTSIKTPEQALIIIMKGRELGVPPMQAFSSIAVVNGKPTMSAELMLSMIYRNVPGAVVDYVKTTNTDCVIEAQRPGGKRTPFSFTMDDARNANLVGKGPWQQYPAAMLRARCISAMARAMFADALSGVVYTPEELGAQVSVDGHIIDIPTQPEPEAKPTAQIAAQHVKPAAQMGLDSPGQYIIRKAKKEWEGLSIAEAVEKYGLPAFQKDVDWWANQSIRKSWLEIIHLSENTYAYAAELKSKAMDQEAARAAR